MSANMLSDVPTGSPIGTGGADMDLIGVQSETNQLLRRVAQSLHKVTPDVLASVLVSGANPILAGDVQGHKVNFTINGKLCMVYRVMLFSTYQGVVGVSPVGMNNVLAGIQLSAVPIFLDIPISELYIATDGAAVCNINAPADPTAGGVYIYPFTIPDYDARMVL